MLLWLTAAPWAVACPDVSDEVEAGWAAFDDAELQQAGGHVKSAYDALDCQKTVVPTRTLLGLYRLDALISMSTADRDGGVYATIRAVTADPESSPPETLGPDLAELHQTWVVRLSGTKAVLEVTGGGDVWVDGQPLPAPRRIEVLEGEHLLQYESGDGFMSVVR